MPWHCGLLPQRPVIIKVVRRCLRQAIGCRSLTCRSQVSLPPLCRISPTDWCRWLRSMLENYAHGLLDLRRCVHFYEINKNGLLWRRRFGKPKRRGCKMLTSKYRIKHWKVFRKTQKAKYTSHYILHIFLIFSPLRTKQQIRTFSSFSSCFDVKLLTWNNQQPPFPLEDWIVFQPIKKERALLCNRAPFQGRSGWNLCRQENVQTPGSVAVT